MSWIRADAQDRGDIEDEDSMLARREIYEAEVPEGAFVLICGVDTQDNRFEYEVVGHGHNGETWGIRCGVSHIIRCVF